MGNGEWGMGHWAWGIGHWALGMELKISLVSLVSPTALHPYTPN
ncbi:MAG: hypothetical protein ACRAVC_22875 [Trichormus sp.]